MDIVKGAIVSCERGLYRIEDFCVDGVLVQNMAVTETNDIAPKGGPVLLSYDRVISDIGDDFLFEAVDEEGLYLLSAEKTDDRTIVFRNLYGFDGLCLSEEIVGWCYGEADEDRIRELAWSRSLKAIYRP